LKASQRGQVKKIGCNQFFLKKTAHFFAIGGKFRGYFDYPLLKSIEFHKNEDFDSKTSYFNLWHELNIVFCSDFTF
jgi:hypothetical protein